MASSDERQDSQHVYSLLIKDKLSEISFGRDQKKYVVCGMNKNSTAHKLGLKLNDKLVSIDGVAVHEIKYREFYDHDLPFIATFKRGEENIANVHILKQRTNKKKCDPMIEQHVVQKRSRNKEIYFDKATVTKSSKFKDKVCLLSTKGFNEGCHEWSIQILKCDIDAQEIGVIAARDIDYIRVHRNGLKGTKRFGARAFYGNELGTAHIYYGSFDNNSSCRCYQDLSKKSHIGWGANDYVTVKLDLDHWKITFFLNGVKVRKVMSVQKGNTYYPILLFSGMCKYRLVDQM